MIFTSIDFLIFLPVVLLFYWGAFKNKFHHQNILILAASYLFYGWWDYRFLSLLIFSTFLDYFSGLTIYNSKNEKIRKIWLISSICINLGLLIFFKYFNFFIDSLQHLLTSINIHSNISTLNIILPIGISFYTFHGISYLLDIYNSKFTPTKNFIDYSVFVSFFPLLVAGPIERATHLLPQIQRNRFYDDEKILNGIRLILWGCFKKIVISDSLSPTVDNIFNNYSTLPGSTLLLGAFYFSIQIYSDFSGYSDIAMGVAKLMGFELISNFKFPYFSRDIAEFWRRWHISLSSWFRDYVYIPLGGSKNGKIKSIRNIFIIFLLSGFWHGANWTYIVWGAIHACLYIPIFLRGKNRKHVSSVVAENTIFPNFRELIQITFTFTIVTIAWIFFRSNDVQSALGFIAKIPNNLFAVPDKAISSRMFFCLSLIVLDWFMRRNERSISLPLNWNISKFNISSFIFDIALFEAIVFFGSENFSETPFIYFQF